MVERSLSMWEISDASTFNLLKSTQFKKNLKSKLKNETHNCSCRREEGVNTGGFGNISLQYDPHVPGMFPPFVVIFSHNKSRFSSSPFWPCSSLTLLSKSSSRPKWSESSQFPGIPENSVCLKRRQMSSLDKGLRLWPRLYNLAYPPCNWCRHLGSSVKRGRVRTVPRAGWQHGQKTIAKSSVK
jgi:hypothetical protein